MVWQQEHRLSYEDFLERHRAVRYLLIALFLLLGARLFHLQIILGRHFFNLSERQRTHIVLERAPRGIIYDCNGDVIVGNRTTFVALFYPFSQDIMPTPAMLDRLQHILDMKNLTAQMTQGLRTGKAVRLAENLTRTEMMRLQEQRLMFPGISVVKEARREYRSPETNSHLVGYLNEITKQELDRLGDEGYKMGDWIGRSGLEQVYDGYLRGQDGGWEIEVDASGHQTQLVRYIPPAKGRSLHTSIDAKLQEVAAAALRRTSTGKGAVVGLDPRTGAVKILVSTPGFDPNAAMLPEFGRYLKNKNLPLFNRSVQALYPPGSIFKIISFAAAVAENRIDPQQAFICTGKFVFGNKTFKCWQKKGHGRMTLIPAMANSCDVYFYQMGLKEGPELIQKYARMFHLGEITGIDIPNEKRGLVPSLEWKKAKTGETWHPGDTINMAIGQGPLWVSPAQMALMISIVANRGSVYKPYIVDSVQDADGKDVYKARPKKVAAVNMPDRAWDLLQKALEVTVSEGTGHACIFDNLKVAGKTGTAQNPHGMDHAWFVAYAPVRDPQLALAVVVENGGGGSAVAAPIAREIFSAAFRLNENKKLELDNAEEIRN